MQRLARGSVWIHSYVRIEQRGFSPEVFRENRSTQVTQVGQNFKGWDKHSRTVSKIAEPADAPRESMEARDEVYEEVLEVPSTQTLYWSYGFCEQRRLAVGVPVRFFRD